MEKDLRRCRNCNELKIRILDGRYPNKKDKRYVDESGRQWSGSVCSVCKRAQSKKTMRRIRAGA